MGDFRKNILKTDFGGKFLQGNTRPSEKKNLTPFYVGKKIILTQTKSPITHTSFKGQMGDP